MLVPYWDAPGRPRLLGLVARHFDGWRPQVGLASSRAQALNQAAAETEGTILLFNDADTIVPAAQLEVAVSWAYYAPGLVYAYTRYRRLSRERTEQIRDPQDVFAGVGVEWQQEDAPSTGCAAISRECFEQIGGFDERFQDWGYEDLAFRSACERYWPTRRVPGDLFHLWHGERRADDSPVSADASAVARNLRLYNREYAAAR